MDIFGYFIKGMLAMIGFFAFIAIFITLTLIVFNAIANMM